MCAKRVQILVCANNRSHTLTAILSQISRKLPNGGVRLPISWELKCVPENQTLLLAIVNVLLEIQHIVSGKEITAIGALDHTGRRGGRPCRWVFVHNQACRWCSGSSLERLLTTHREI